MGDVTETFKYNKGVNKVQEVRIFNVKLRTWCHELKLADRRS